MVDERRKFERVVMPHNANVYVATPDEKKLGGLRMLGRGGFQVETSRTFTMVARANAGSVSSTRLSFDRSTWMAMM